MGLNFNILIKYTLTGFLIILSAYFFSIGYLYLNSNNGYTRFKEGGKIFSERNKLVKFKGNKYHTGSTCTDKEYRSIINFNYIPLSPLS